MSVSAPVLHPIEVTNKHSNQYMMCSRNLFENIIL